MYSSALAPERAGAAVAAPLPCHNGNISPLDDEICPLLPRKSVPTYYRRRKVEVENNIREFARKIGLKYGGDYMRPESVQEVARAHIAEFTITLAGAGRYERGRLSAAWDKFNRKFLLSDSGQELFGDWVRVFECHKDGALHAHVIIECKKDLRKFVNGRPIPFKLRHYRGYMAVDGASCAAWVVKLRERLRGGLLGRYGLGSRHTFQPIYKGVNEAAKYVSKYVAKSVMERPPNVKGVRVVAYSRGFDRMLRVIGYDKSEKIRYFSKKHQCFKWRYKTFLLFDVNSAASRVRRLRLRKFAHYIGAVNLDDIKHTLGNRWAWDTFRAVNSVCFTRRELKRLSNWEKLAAFKHDSAPFRPLMLRTEKQGYIPCERANFKECGAWEPVGFLQDGRLISLERESRLNRLRKYNAIAEIRSKFHHSGGGRPLSILWNRETLMRAYRARVDCMDRDAWPRVHRLTRIISKMTNVIGGVNERFFDDLRRVFQTVECVGEKIVVSVVGGRRRVCEKVFKQEEIIYANVN